MVPPGANPTPTYYHPTFEDSSWSSDHIRSETAKERVMVKQDRVVQRSVLRRRKGSCCKYWSRFRDLFYVDDRRNARELDAFIPHERWRAYGYSPHPLVDRVQVQGSAFRYSSAITINPEDFRRRSRSVNGSSQGPDERSGRNAHPGSHPPPYNWSWAQFPAPRDVRLHPSLQHRCNGPQSIFFDIALGPHKIMRTVRESAKAPLDPALFAQPATHPTVTHMHIEVVSEDPLPHFPWPIEIFNAQGITCGDVFEAIARKFTEHISEDEYNSWAPHRKTTAARAYHRRVRTSSDTAKPGEIPNVAIGLRRLDYIGEKVAFRGLEQAASMLEDTWFMYFGLA